MKAILLIISSILVVSCSDTRNTPYKTRETLIKEAREAKFAQEQEAKLALEAKASEGESDSDQSEQREAQGVVAGNTDAVPSKLDLALEDEEIQEYLKEMTEELTSEDRTEEPQDIVANNYPEDIARRLEEVLNDGRKVEVVITPIIVPQGDDSGDSDELEIVKDSKLEITFDDEEAEDFIVVSEILK